MATKSRFVFWHLGSSTKRENVKKKTKTLIAVSFVSCKYCVNFPISKEKKGISVVSTLTTDTYMYVANPAANVLLLVRTNEKKTDVPPTFRPRPLPLSICFFLCVCVVSDSMAPPPWRKIHAHFALSCASLFQFLYQFFCQLDGKWTKNMKPFLPSYWPCPPTEWMKGKIEEKSGMCFSKRANSKRNNAFF